MNKQTSPARAPLLALALLVTFAFFGAATSTTYYEHGAYNASLATTGVLNTSLPLGTLQTSTATFPASATSEAWNFTKDVSEASALLITNTPVTFKGTFNAEQSGQDENFVYLNWQLVERYANGTENQICRTPTGTSGQLITSANNQNLTASCTPAANYTLTVGSRLRVNLYGFNSDTSNAHAIIHSWDTATANSNVNLDQVAPPSDTTPPQYSQVTQNTSTPSESQSVALSVFWTDNVALSGAVLETNESGVPQNKTSGTYGSPLTLSGASAYSNFTWTNNSVPAGTTVSWRVWSNDSSGNWNATPTTTFTVQPGPRVNATVSSPTSNQALNVNQSFLLSLTVYCGSGGPCNNVLVTPTDCTGSLACTPNTNLTPTSSGLQSNTSSYTVNISTNGNATLVFNVTANATGTYTVGGNATGPLNTVPSNNTIGVSVTTGPTVTTDKAAYNACGVVWYKAFVYDNASNLINPATFRAEFYNGTNASTPGALVAVQAGATTNGVFTSRFTLPPKAGIDLWMIRALADNVIGRAIFPIGILNAPGFSNYLSGMTCTSGLQGNRIAYQWGENMTAYVTVTSLGGLPVTGLNSSKLSFSVSNGGSEPVQPFTEDGGGTYQSTVNTSTLIANDFHSYRIKYTPNGPYEFECHVNFYVTST